MSSERSETGSARPAAALPKDHYEALGLQQNCTEKQVKAAFITLSKVHHPDLNPTDPSQKEKFVRIYEAYETLSRPDKRIIYDSDLLFQRRVRQEYQDGLRVRSNAPQYRAWRDDSIWSMRDRADRARQDYNGDYYGIKGVKRVSNYWVAGGAVCVMLLGTMVHYAAYKHGGPFSVKQLDTRDERIARELFNTRRNAQKYNSNDQQLEAMTSRLGWVAIEEPATDKGAK